METGLLVAYFGNDHKAQRAMWEMLRRGVRRIALIHKTEDGTIRVTDPFFLVRNLSLLALSTVAAVVSEAIFLLLRGLTIPSHVEPIAYLPAIIGALTAAATGWLTFRRSRFGVSRKLIADHARWLIPEETVLILVASMRDFRRPLVTLQETGESAPAIFLMHPSRGMPGEVVHLSGTASTIAQIEEHALRLAKEHLADSHGKRDFQLLDRLTRTRSWLRKTVIDLSDAVRMEQAATPAVEWILDNEYILEGNARDVQLNLTRKFFRKLPLLQNESFEGLPRVYALAKELVAHSELHVDREMLCVFLEAYQTIKVLTIGELWAFPQMLRIALIEGVQYHMAQAVKELRERELATYWANRLISINRKDPGLFFSFLAELAEQQPNPSPYFASQLMGNLYDETTALIPVQNWLERTLKRSLGDLNLREQTRQSKELVSIGNAVTSLRQLALLDWRKMFERLSHVEQLLRMDPAGIYPKMDFPTRDQYRRAVEELARGSQLEEVQVARLVHKRASESAVRGEDIPRMHNGLHLIGTGRREMAKLLSCREPFAARVLQVIWRYHTPAYFAGFAVPTVLILFLVATLFLGEVSPGWRILICLLLLLPLSQLTLNAENYLITRFIPPRLLPKMDFEEAGIPDEYRTLIVVPILLADCQTIQTEVDKLEIRHLANPEPNLLYSLFTDFTDCDSPSCEEDAVLLKAVVARLEELNRRTGESRFYLFHRERTWSESEQRYIGWERKRGKLEELNRMIDGTRPADAPNVLHLGDAEQLSTVRFIITLDSDTQLPRGTARRMIETMAHPLNQTRIDPRRKVVTEGYAVIQPRVSPSLPSVNLTPFSRLYADAVGIDPYTLAVSDSYMDLAGEGSYHGKGIYDVQVFSRLLSGRFPQGWLLSHDLLEGAHARVGLASDIELYDEFPQDYSSYAARQHRWIRGDWQVADWMLPAVPTSGNDRAANTLSGFNRWKIFDNLRRSLLPAANVGLLILSWLISPAAGVAAGLIVSLELLFESAILVTTWSTTREGWRAFSISKLSHDLLQAIARASMLPSQAGMSLDAILRVWYRQRISKRRLLEWNSSQLVRDDGPPERLNPFILSLGTVSLLSAVMAAVIVWRMPGSIVPALPWLALWFFSPLTGWLLNRKPLERPARTQLPSTDQRYLRRIARRTWRYFTDYAGENTNYLPPDNLQVSHHGRLAMRTSPTNIGLWMLSQLAARSFGYQSVDRMIVTLSRTMETIAKLERYEGHLLNWYDIGTLAPLEPRYVSTVDSGNLIGAMWALGQGLRLQLEAPVLGRSVFQGLRDTGDVLLQCLKKSGRYKTSRRTLEGYLAAWEQGPGKSVETIRHLRNQDAVLRSFTVAWEETFSEADIEARYWADQLSRQNTAELETVNRYLQWLEILLEKTDEETARLDENLPAAIRRDLEEAPSLARLATGDVESIRLLQAVRQRYPQSAPPFGGWIDRILKAYSDSKWLAGEMLAKGRQVIRETRQLADSMDLRFLYDRERRLFSIGYNVSQASRDPAYYDLLASEARLASFVAVARGEIPMEHWFSLGRRYNSVGRKRVLLSWTGTMFEYLMPELLLNAFEHSLLEKAVKDAVAIQREYGRARRVPWGISESAFGDLDIGKTYQYKAFGVPSLGLKRGLGEELVVAPYASMLALAVLPRETVDNLRALERLGLLSDYGFFEAIDFSRPPDRGGKRGVIVRTYMAHHQGMGFLSFANFFHDGVFRRLFHADMRVRSAEPLLQERIPVLPSLYHIPQRERTTALPGAIESIPMVSRFDTPHTETPKTMLLSNSRYGLMVTNAGGGFSRWNEMDITRWRSDRTQDPGGFFCYIRELDSGRIWSNTYHPAGVKGESYLAHFTLDRASFRRADSGIETETEIVVSPEEDVEVRRITLTNSSVRARRLELTSYIELAMSPHSADRQHPAFQKLFIQTEADAGLRALLARRRPRDAEDPPVFAGHRITVDKPNPDWQFETDRRTFIGRGRSLMRPMALEGALGNSQGFVLDPIFSLRHTVILSPGQRVRMSLVLAAGSSREQVAALMGKYSDPHVVERAMDLAWAETQLGMRLLRIQPEEARRFQKLASHMLFPNPLMRPAAMRMEENRKGQSGLWPYGISGDLPIALVSVGEARELGLIRQVLQAHSYWRMHGLKADLVVVNEEASGYERPLRERLDELIRANSMYTGVHCPGGVYLLDADQIPDDDMKLLHSVSRLVLVGARGTLPQQLGVPMELPDVPDPLPHKRILREPSAPLPFLELPYFNSLGGFTPDGREYAVYLGPNTHTPAPWVNVIANPQFGTMMSEAGSGSSWYGNSQRNRLTQWSNDPVGDPPSEAVFIRDEESGEYWTPTALPIREDTAYRARHGAGYTVYEHNSHAIEQELTVFVPLDEHGGDPLKIQRLRLKNDSSRRRRISVTYYVEWTLEEHRELSQMHILTRWDEDLQAVIARNRYHPEYGGRVAFVTMRPGVDSYTADRTTFLGRNQPLSNPVAMGQIRLPQRTGAGFDPCAAVQKALDIAPGETVEVTCILGQAESFEEAQRLLLAYRDESAVETALRRTQEFWDQLLGTIQVHTPELAIDFMINRWLLYQVLSCRVWARSAFYQSGGAFGFRDQLQDCLALLYADPPTVRAHILRAASRQFTEGDVQHWWHPPSGAGVRTRISDDLLWLPWVTGEYIRATGDQSILHEMVPFLDAPLLTEDQSEVFLTPEISSARATLYEHCRRAVAQSMSFGPRGMPLIGTGDWNDGMNRVGVGGRGESAWLGWFLADVLKTMRDLAEVMGNSEQAAGYMQKREDLARRMEESAWDGSWYLRATFDDGSLIGSAGNAEARIDSIPQSWARLSGAAEEERVRQALDAVWERLVREDEGLVQLFDPPFDHSNPSPGYLQGYPPGVRENGGQYTHAAVWYAMALARSGQGERASKILRMLNPIERTRDADAVWRYGVEPYVIPADVYRLEGRVGHGGWSWYTGSAAWMYRAWVEEILGLKVRGGWLSFDPVIPSRWEGFHMLFRHGEALYDIRVENPERVERGIISVEQDGRPVPDGRIKLERALVKHRIFIRMGRG